MSSSAEDVEIAPRDQTLFLDALDLPGGPERDQFLEEACEDEAERAEIQQLLAAFDDADAFLETPPMLVAEHREEADSIVEEPGDRIGPYELVREIGEGGFGIVFEARQREPIKRRVALKIVKPGMDTRALIARFEAERQALAMLDHPNIAQIHDAGASDSGRPFFAMEFVDGEPIVDFCDRSELSIEGRIELLAAVCEAVQHAHSKGVVHRDLKPSNVLITEVSGRAEPKIIDFGIAKIVDDSEERTLLTRQGQFVGTPLYTSPEQARTAGNGADTRSDVFALGALLHELLTGKPPLDPESLRDLSQARLEERIAEFEANPPSSARAGLPRELDWIALRALENDPNRRYQTPLDLARDLRRFLAHEPLEASPPSRIYRARKFIRRHRAGIAVASILTAILVIAAAVSLRQAAVADARRIDAEQARDEAERISAFLTEIIRDTSPDGKALSAETLLDRASRRVDEVFPDEPAIRAPAQRAGNELCRGRLSRKSNRPARGRARDLPPAAAGVARTVLDLADEPVRPAEKGRPNRRSPAAGRGGAAVGRTKIAGRSRSGPNPLRAHAPRSDSDWRRP